MITFSLGSQFLRALVVDDTGNPLAADSVVATMKNSGGGVVPQINNAAMQAVTGQPTYNFQYEVPASFAPAPGILYQVTLVITSGARSRAKTFDATVVP